MFGTPAFARNLGLGIALILIVIATLAVAGHGAVVDQGVNDTGRIVGKASSAVDRTRSRAVHHVKHRLAKRVVEAAA